jgi:hypothetical protein
MQRPEFSEEQWRWDTYREFHVNMAPVVYFKTGEVICTNQSPNIDNRHGYPGGLRVDTTAKCGSLWAPDGRELKNAWLDDGGQQHLFIDEHANRCVRLDGGGNRYRDNEGNVVTGYYGSGQSRPAEFLPGVPERFQANAYAYIGGPGCPPVGNGKIVAWVSLQKALTAEQREHVRMIEETARAAMKLMDDPKMNNTVNPSTSITKGCPLRLVLAAQTWRDIPEGNLAELYRNGAQRDRWEFDWCYWTETAHAIRA